MRPDFVQGMEPDWMKYTRKAWGIIIVIAIIAGAVYFGIKLEKDMTITSAAFENNTRIPAKYTCDGDNINPPLEIAGVPGGAKSLVLIMDDPDAPAGVWVHWTLWNINPGTAEISENSAPAGATQGLTSFGKPGYGGPCPPSGTHRYFFKFYALDTILDLAADADKAALEVAMAGHILEKTEIIGLYSR